MFLARIKIVEIVRKVKIYVLEVVLKDFTSRTKNVQDVMEKTLIVIKL